jgi:hemoglobin-like flavoprotein
MDPVLLSTFEASLERCSKHPAFLDQFYDCFLASSSKVREKFIQTNFPRQKKALRASFELLVLAAREGEGGPGAHLASLAERHGASHLAIGAEYYDLWLDSLLTTVQACDPRYSPAVEKAWESVMGFGIRYLCSRYNG